MIGFIIVLHVIICILLMVVVLIQAGRGGGLVEGFSGMESMFGTKTNAFLTRTTTVLSILFFTTCLTLAVLSARQGKSLLRNVTPKPVASSEATQTAEIPEPGEKAKTEKQAEQKEEPAAKAEPAEADIPKK